MANKVFNPTFSNNLDGWAARNGATITRITTDTYFGRGAVEVTVDETLAESGIYGLNARPNYVVGSQVTFSVYVKVPEGSPDITLTPALYFYNSSGSYVSAYLGPDTQISSEDGWVRMYMTGMATTSTATTVAVGLIASDEYIYVDGAKFIADAFMLEDGGILNVFVEGDVTQAVKNQAVNIALTKLPQPHLTGMKLRGDVRINGLTLNTIDEYDIVWVCREIEGWWNLSNVDTPDIARGLDDGSYDVRGRRTARALTIEGSILVPDPSLTPYARQKLMEAFNLVYEGAWLYVDETPTKAAYVRLVGQPTMLNTTARGRIDFSIPLRASDPIKYSWDEAFNDGYSAVGLTNLFSNPNFDGNSTTGWATNTGITSIAASTDYAYDGTYSLKVTANGSSSNFGLFASSSLPIDGGDTYTVSAYVRDANTAVQYRVLLYWYETNVGGAPTIGSSQGERTTVDATGWTRVSATAKAPANANYVWCIISSTSTPANGTIAYFDGAELRKTKELAGLDQNPNLLPNPSFEGGSTSNWGVGSGVSSIAASTDTAIDGDYSLKVTANGASANFGAYIVGGNRPKVHGGRVYSWSMHVKDVNTGVTFRGQLGWYDASGTLISTSSGTLTSVNTSTWTRVSLIETAPSNATSVQPILYTTTTPTNGTIAYFDYAELREIESSPKTYIPNNASNLSITNYGNANVAAVYKLTGPITAPAYIVSTSGNTTQTITVNTNLRDTTASSSITASEFSAGVATLTTSAANSFMVGDRVIIDASNNYYDGTVTLTAATDTSVSYANPITNVASITHSSNRADVTTATAHGLTAGTTFYIGGSSNPVLDGAYTVLASPTPTTNTFSYTKTTSNQTTGYGGTLSRQIAYSAATTGTITLAQVDTLEIDTYNKTVLYRGLPDSSRSTVAVNVDWIQLAPGENLHTFSKTNGTGSAEVKYRSGWIG